MENTWVAFMGLSEDVQGQKSLVIVGETFRVFLLGINGNTPEKPSREIFLSDYTLERVRKLKVTPFMSLLLNPISKDIIINGYAFRFAETREEALIQNEVEQKINLTNLTSYQTTTVYSLAHNY